jgi:hypothetical protein
LTHIEFVTGIPGKSLKYPNGRRYSRKLPWMALIQPWKLSELRRNSA